MNWSRRDALRTLLAGVASLGLPGCKEERSSPGASPPASTTQLEHARISAALQSVFAGTPWAGVAATLADDMQASIDQLVADGLTETASLVTGMVNSLMLGAYEFAAADPDDSAAQAQPVADLTVALLEQREQLVAQLAASVTELQDLNDGRDTVEAALLDEGRSVLEEHEATMRAWLHEEGLSGEAFSNTLLRVLATQRAELTSAHAISEDLDSLTEALNAFGTADAANTHLWSALFADGDAPDGPPPPPGKVDICGVLLVLSILFAPVFLGGSLARATSEVDELLSIQLLFLKNYNSYPLTALFDQLHEDEQCDVLIMLLQTLAQLFSLLMTLMALFAILMAFSGGIGLLVGILLVFQAIVVAGGGLCTFQSMVSDMQRYGRECE